MDIGKVVRILELPDVDDAPIPIELPKEDPIPVELPKKVEEVEREMR